MTNRFFKTIGVVSAALIFCFILSAPAILSIVNSPWWLLIYPLYIVAYMTDSVGVEYIEYEEEDVA